MLLALALAGALTVAPDPAVPVAGLVSVRQDACFTTREVQFDSALGDVTIAGGLTVPSGGPERKPAVLMITGSGPHTRDQMISDTPMFKLIGDHLAHLGFVVLRTDARGFGGSTGPDDFEQSTTAERIQDNLAALAFLKAQPEVDPGRIILFGHSEGGVIAADIAGSDPAPALVVLLSTSTIHGERVLAYQGTQGLRRAGRPEAAAVQNEFLTFLRYLASGRDDPAEFTRIARAFLDAHGPEAAAMDVSVGEAALSGYLKSRWDRHFAGYDPAPALSRIQSPILAIFAEKDENTPVAQHLPAFAAAVAAGRSHDVHVAVLPDQDHMYLEYEGERLERHRPGEMEVATELLDLLDLELEARFPLSSPCSWGAT